MRSLSTKLVLAFALTSLAGIALAAFFVRQSVVNEFDAYVLQQRRDEFVSQLSAYYTQYGSWAGVEQVLRTTHTHDNDGDPGPRIDFVLADAGGTILLSPNPLWRGRAVPADELALGTAVTVGGQTVGTVLTLAPPARRNPAEQLYLARTDRALAAAGLGAVAVALVLGLLLARVITRPVRDLTAAARAIAGGDLRQHVTVRSRDEIGELAVQFNHMSADLDRATELRRRMTADIAHDLRTPLTVLSGYLEALRDETLRPTPARLAAMHDETQVLLHLVEDLHTLSLADAGELPLKRQPVEPRPLLERMAYLYQHAATQAGVTLGVQAPPDLPTVSGDVEQLARALGNLVSNALRHTPQGGAVTLAAYQADRFC
ncbi:MAG: HAMP domain-containing protein, partial [Chloroflexales bacterium]|nr:HAMP domain-containing protein [Chloroflexales bacterium]